MAKKKPTKSVLKKVGGAAATGAEAVKAVGEMMPTGKAAPKLAKVKAKAKAPKVAAKAPTAKVEKKVEAPKGKKAAPKGAAASKTSKPAAKAAPGRKK